MKLSDRAKDIIEWIVCILIAVILALLIRYYIGTLTVVQQQSMYPTLEPGQRLILNRWVRTTNQMPERGDIVTFEAPSQDYPVLSADFDSTNLVARYLDNPTNWVSKFVYYVLETSKESYIKRVIGLPGDHIQIRDGKVYINSEEYSEPYLQDNVTTTVGSDQPFSDLVVPENCLFVMGDNRDHSTDSRAFGCIPLNKLEGKVWIRCWPFNLFGKVE